MTVRNRYDFILSTALFHNHKKLARNIYFIGREQKGYTVDHGTSVIRFIVSKPFIRLVFWGTPSSPPTGAKFVEAVFFGNGTPEGRRNAFMRLVYYYGDNVPLNFRCGIPKGPMESAIRHDFKALRDMGILTELFEDAPPPGPPQNQWLRDFLIDCGEVKRSIQHKLREALQGIDYATRDLRYHDAIGHLTPGTCPMKHCIEFSRDWGKLFPVIQSDGIAHAAHLYPDILNKWGII